MYAVDWCWSNIVLIWWMERKMSDRNKIKQQQILIDVAKRGEEWKKKTKWIVQMNIHEIMWYHLIWDGTNCKVADDKIYRSNATFSSQIGRVFFSPPCILRLSCLFSCSLFYGADEKKNQSYANINNATMDRKTPNQKQNEEVDK